MTNLKDPDKPAHHVIKVNDDGSALRNDGAILSSADKNIWYIMMTAHGVHLDNKFDQELHDRNLRIWNGWACAGLSEEERKTVIAKLGVDATVCAPLSDAEQSDLLKVLRQRTGNPDAAIPINPDTVITINSDTEIPAVTDVQTINLSNTYFPNSIYASQFYFPSQLNFDEVVFSKGVYFRNTIFADWTSFGGATFAGANFDKTVFNKVAIFKNAVFDGEVRFIYVEFSSFVYFENAMFNEPTEFIRVAFGSITDFQGVSFKKIAGFISVSFKKRTNFANTNFNAKAVFGSAIFTEKADFSMVVFMGVSVFSNTSFRQAAIFSRASFKREAYFDKTTFLGIADFSDTSFLTQTTFSEARFALEVPKFYEAQLHRDTDFTMQARNWPSITRKNARRSKRAYIRLRQIMNQFHYRDDEQFFSRREMECKSLLEGWLYKVLSSCYKWTSEYGHSVGRPAMALMILVLLCGLMYYCGWIDNAGTQHYAQDISGFLGAMGQSFSNSFPFFGFQRLYYGPDVIKDLPTGLRILSGVQTIISFFLIFLLGLGLRNRFRLK